MAREGSASASRTQAVGFASAIGGLAGATLSGHRGRRAAAVGAIAGAVCLGALEAVARARQRPGEIPALWQRIPAADLPFVVPLEARTRYVGTGYVRELAEVLGGTYLADAPDVGIVASLDELAGPQFAPAEVDQRVREFYEHTARFTLYTVPAWPLLVRRGYPLYRTLVARTLGQASVPMNQREA